MYTFEVRIQRRPVEAVDGDCLTLRGGSHRTLGVRPAMLAAAVLPVTFEQAETALAALPRLFIEPDGSFVWVGERCGRGDANTPGLTPRGSPGTPGLTPRGSPGTPGLTPRGSPGTPGLTPRGSPGVAACSWQVDGQLYDRQGRLVYAELKGRCPPAALDELLRACGWPGVPLMFQLIHEAVYLDEAEFRCYAATSADADSLSRDREAAP